MADPHIELLAVKWLSPLHRSKSTRAVQAIEGIAGVHPAHVQAMGCEPLCWKFTRFQFRFMAERLRQHLSVPVLPLFPSVMAEIPAKPRIGCFGMVGDSLPPPRRQFEQH